MEAAYIYKEEVEVATTNEEGIMQLYNEATKDYEIWSKDLNMHFGYYIPFKTNLFKRDTMLNEMNRQLFSRLNIEDKKAHILDMGCGMGATMKYGINEYPKLAVTGCTLSSFQVEFGNKFVNSERGSIINSDYRKTQFEDNKFDGVLGVESFCHSGCAIETLQEAYRVLKPNSKLVIADAFTKKGVDKMNPLSKKVNKGLCECWSLEKLGNITQIKEDLKAIGFKNIEIKNIWYNVAPSVLHVPFVIAAFVFKKLLKNEPLKKESMANMKGSFYALLSSLCLQDFGYYIITAEK